jgi:hypothetical protein
MDSTILPKKVDGEMWGILELMGHVRLGGRITEEERFGSKMGRIDIPNKDGGFTTQFFGGSSVYRLTPTSEEAARHVALNCQPTPVHSWELPKPALTHAREPDFGVDESPIDGGDEPSDLEP